MDDVFDVAIIGGGINGCGCAADAALRGLSVVLFEQDDLASKTSSSSTKLIHGGLRYLEQYEFWLVKKALDERQRLLDLAPHLVHQQVFIIPDQKSLRPAWLLRLGLFFYDHLSRKNRLPQCKSIQRNLNNTYFNPLSDAYKQGFLFYDASTDDARLTITNALQAKNHGASIRPHATVIHTQTVGPLWQLTVQPKVGMSYTVTAKTLINASGPWIESVAKMTEIPVQHPMTLVKGSHILVAKLYEGQQAYFLQHSDKRIVFVIPYHGFSMIGTTNIPYSGLPDEVHISGEEINYLTSVVNTYFQIALSKNDMIYSWSGLRPLLAVAGKEHNALSRDYTFELTTSPAPAVTIYGGKITTYRQLAEEVINQLRCVFPQMNPTQTRHTPLPGACFNRMNFEQYVLYAKDKYSWLHPDLLSRYLFNYGSCMELFLSRCKDMESMGEKFGSSLYQVEVDYLLREEWACDYDDILTRRTKLGLTMDATSKKELTKYLERTTIVVPAEPVSR